MALSTSGDAQSYLKLFKHINMVIITRKILILASFYILSAVQTGAGDDWIGYAESGQASYYAYNFQNRKTASGEIYEHDLKTAAHNKLPFGSIVKVTNRRNGKVIIVKINDRGPFVKGRIIDLSWSAFSSIANTSTGLIDVKIEVIP